MRKAENREALSVYALVKYMLAKSGSDSLTFAAERRMLGRSETRIAIKKIDNVVSVTHSPLGFTSLVLCVVDSGDGDPTIVSFRPGAWKKILQRQAALQDAQQEAMKVLDAELAETI